MKELVAVVVLYNFNEKVIENIMSYNKYCKIVYAIDNSETKSKYEHELRKIDNLEYIRLGENYGIAKALNEGIKLAQKVNTKWVLTMDQDSYINNDIIKVYEEELKKLNAEDIAILSPVYNIDRKKLEVYKGIKEKEYSMQSANLINIDVYNKIGDFKEDFFIDVVDYEYCLRARKNGYKIIQCGEAILEHSPAITKEKKIFGKKIQFGYCSPIRIYYQARNLLWTAKKYKSIKMLEILIVKLLKILLLFDNKKKFLKYYAKGIKDCIKNRFGKGEEI